MQKEKNFSLFLGSLVDTVQLFKKMKIDDPTKQLLKIFSCNTTGKKIRLNEQDLKMLLSNDPSKQNTIRSKMNGADFSTAIKSLETAVGWLFISRHLKVSNIRKDHGKLQNLSETLWHLLGIRIRIDEPNKSARIIGKHFLWLEYTEPKNVNKALTEFLEIDPSS